MSHPRIVLCAVDLTDIAVREVEMAAEICDAFAARLVLQHNVAAVPPGLTRAWEWNVVDRTGRQPASMVDRRLRDIMNTLPRTFPVEATVTAGSVVPIVVELATRLPADLIVLGSHGWSTDEHTSVAERILDRAPCPVLTVHDPATPVAPVRMRARQGHAPPEVLVPTDLGVGSAHVLAYAFDLARELGLHLHLLHVEGALATPHAREATARGMVDLLPPDLAGRVECHVATGDPVERIIDFMCERLPAYAIMGQHARGFFRRIFTRDTARQMLHRAPCPVWFVPPR